MNDKCVHCNRCKGGCDYCQCCGKCQRCGAVKLAPTVNPPTFVPVPYPVPAPQPAPVWPWPDYWWTTTTIPQPLRVGEVRITCGSAHNGATVMDHPHGQNIMGTQYFA